MKKIENQGNIVAFFVIGVLVGLILLIGIARITWHTKFYPGVSVAGVEIAGLTREQAFVKLSEVTNAYQVELIFNGGGWETPHEAVMFDAQSTLNEAYQYGRRSQIEDYLLLLVNKRTNYPLQIAEGKTSKLEGLINEIASNIEIPPIEPTIEVVDKDIKVVNGTDGVVLDTNLLSQRIEESASYLSSEPIEIPTTTAKRQLTAEDMSQLRSKAEKLLGKDLGLTLDDERLRLKADDLIALLATDGGSEMLNKQAVEEYVSGLSESLNKEPRDAKFEFVEGRVKEFAPGMDGVEVNLQLTKSNLESGIEKLLSSDDKSLTIEIAVTRTPPKVTTEKVNELGIRERIGRGESYYAHSIANRIYNVGLASARANSALVPPGAEFSFNQTVGEVSGATGYRPAYVISGGRTVLDDGGGLCQVSTTVFRAAMNAGLPITERWAHAYRVGYYEQNSKAGIDATVYAPSKDLKFKNDTPGHVLVQFINDPKNLHLVVEIYGTADGRVATMSQPKIWGITPPLPTIYQDDPSLPTGTLKQVDWAASGAKASFEYRVVRGEELIQEKTFTSNYRAWASVFLKGTGQ